MTLATNDPNDVGTYNVSLNIALADYSRIATITKNFTATVTCTVLSLSYTMVPAVSSTI